MGEHPWFQGILLHRWSREQIILGEVQHYLRIRTNPIFFGYMAINAVADKNYELMQAVLENFMEELAGPKTHMDIMLQFLEEGGISREDADRAEPAPGTLAAIEMIIGCCQRRSALEGVAMLAFVESQLGGVGQVSETVYRELTGHYGFSARAAETYRLHAEQDEGHGNRQIDAIRLLAKDDAIQNRIRAAVKLGLTAFSLEWDGHVQAMTGKREFWGGVTNLNLRQPIVKLA
jgi:pyrroloquinoline quinone (PQQ) biosynthesis protein C